MRLEPVPSTSWLNRAARRLRRTLRGATHRRIRSLPPQGSSREQVLMSAIAATLSSMERAGAESAQVAGVSAILGQPEFRSVARVRELLDLLDAGTLTRRLGSSARASGEVIVYIGGEQDDQVMAGLSTVSATYGNPDHGAGMIAVVGPQRLHYRRAIATVETVASALTSLVASRAA